MEVIVLKNAKAVCEIAAQRIKNLVKNQPGSILGLATGNTPLPLYKNLIELQKNGAVNFSKITTFNLDEYVGLSPEHEASYSFYMKNHFYDPLGLNVDSCFLPNGLAEDVVTECQNYEKKIKEKGPIDLQILGIGRDGHIGFNEPGSSLGSRTRLKTLTETTRKDNASHFSGLDKVPHHVITMGIQTILEAKEILLMATGASKAEAVAAAVEGPVSALVPASALQFHPKARILVDEEAASQLKNLAYYREVFEKKPTWQAAEFI